MLIALFLITSFPAMAESEPLSLSPIQVEGLPFDNSIANVPNTEKLMDEHIATAEKKAGLPQFDVTTFASQIFWLLVMFVVLYVYFAKGALPKLSKTMEDRQSIIRNDLDTADKLSANIDATRTEYEAAMTKAQDDARAEIVKAEGIMRTKADAQSNEFKARSASAVADIEKRAESAKSKIMADLETTVADLTASIVSKLGHIDAPQATIEKAIATHMSATTSASTKKKAA
jgi:F-type H+-transporting ATPase subunit b